MHAVFQPADILLPKNTDLTLFSVVACDQYTSEPAYWEEVARQVGDRPSTLPMIFPEYALKTTDFGAKVESINQTMQDYLKQDLFQCYPDAIFYVERTLRNGTVRRGLIGKIDLECYDYNAGSASLVRPTEGTVLDRIPPRVRIRIDAPLELPHVMLLVDDPEKTVIEPITAKKDELQGLYRFPLMMDSGSIVGYLLDDSMKQQVLTALDRLGDPDRFAEHYGVEGKPVLQFAVGDGNHSLATARSCYQHCKETIGEEAARQHPSRYALVELGNLHDDSLEFEAIHRIITGVSPEALLTAMEQRYQLSECPDAAGQKLTVVVGDTKRQVTICNPSSNLAVGSLQSFLDEAVPALGGEIDYIHGEDVVLSLCKEQADAVGFLLPAMGKDELFPTVILDGALPRKTFSMGEACDKRFYLEARRIRD